MTTNHIDQLAQWWHDAEEGIGKAGDVIIEHDDSPNFETPSYVVFTLGRDEHENLTYRRILARAPKPAWHDAVAVIAHTARFSERRPFALTHTEDVLDPYNTEWITRDDLRDVTPLIEAKVTDEMVKRAHVEMLRLCLGDYSDRALASIITAALGLETE